MSNKAAVSSISGGAIPFEGRSIKMACFLVPTAEAVVVTAVTQVVKSNEQKRMAALPEGE